MHGVLDFAPWQEGIEADCVDNTSFEQRWRRRFIERGTLLEDDAGIAGWTSTGLQTRVRQFEKLWQEYPGVRGEWLDIGCGAGTYTRLLHNQGYSVLGVDYSTPSLSKARERSPDGMHWLAANIHGMPLPDGYAQGVLCFGVIQALDSSGQALREIARVVRTGGEVWIDALNEDCLPTRWSEWRRRRKGLQPHLRYESVTSFKAAFEEAGLRVMNVEWLPILPGRLSRFQPLFETGFMRSLLRRLPILGSLISHSFIVRARRQ